MQTRRALGLLALALPLSATAAPESFIIDIGHTFPYFDVRHNGVEKIRGRFDKTSGRFTLDRAAHSGSVELTVQTATVSTGSNEPGVPRARDDRLRSPDLLNVAEYPSMSFKSTRVSFKGDNPDVIEGNLTLIGVTRPLTLHVENWNCALEKGKMRCGGNATGAFKRTDFGMKYGTPTALGDDVALWLSISGIQE
jgi:polyisoprenoid-binding protein YceI